MILIDRISRFRARGMKDSWLAFWLVFPTVAILIVLGLYPVIRAAYDSFFQIDFITRAHAWAGLANYQAVFTRTEIVQSFSRSFVFTIANMVAQLVLGLGVAMLLNAGLRGQTIARGLVLFPYMVPLVVVALIFRFMFNNLFGVVNYILETVNLIHSPIPFLSDPSIVLWSLIGAHVWKYTPFMVIMFLARLQTIPRDLYEAADIDGASRVARFRFVTLPWLAPVIVIAMLMRTVWVATDFDLPYLLAFGGPVHASTLVPIEIRSLGFEQLDLGQASALAIVLALLLVLTIALYLRYYRRREAELD
jgi:multiple sugar transport system permease protein